MNDADLETLEFVDAARWGFCPHRGDEMRRTILDEHEATCSYKPTTLEEFERVNETA